MFPTSRDRWSTVFKEDLTAWFDVYSISNPSEQQDLQVEGLRESTLHILELMRREIELLGGDSERLVLGGMSQGMATALWALLCSPGQIEGRVGALIGFCGWLPFAERVEDFLKRQRKSRYYDNIGTSSTEIKECSTVTNLLLDIIGQKTTQVCKADIETMHSTPVLLLHGSDDAWVDVELGRHAHRVLVEMGMHVDWNEFIGAENEGHWIKEPEGFDKIVAFLENALLKGGEESRTF